MGPQLLRLAAAAQSGAADASPNGKAVWLELSKTAFALYLRWRKLSSEERDELQNSDLMDYVDAWRRSVGELFEAMKCGNAAVKATLASTQTLLDAVVVKFGIDGDSGLGMAFAEA